MEWQSLAILALVVLWFFDGVASWLQGKRLRTLERRVAWLEQQIEQTEDELDPGRSGSPASAPAGRLVSSPRVLDALRRGKTIEAIKIYREETGTGLKDAKEAVEAIQRSLRPGG